MCPNSKSFSFLISVGVTLDEAIMINPRKKLFDTPKKKKKQQHQSEKKLELKPKAWGTIGKNLVTPNEEEVQHW